MKGKRIAISTFCAIHNVNEAFINSLLVEGLIEVSQNEEGLFIDEEQLQQLEVFTSWYSLGINPEGIDALVHLVAKMRAMQGEINTLRKKLEWYEKEETGTVI